MTTNNTNPSHGKVTTSQSNLNTGNLVIETETFYDDALLGYKREVEESVMVERTNILNHVMRAMDLPYSTINLTIHKDSQLEPKRIVIGYCEVDDRARKQSKPGKY